MRRARAAAIRAGAASLIVVTSLVAADDGVAIARDGNAAATVVVAADAPAPERTAAEELARWLGRATGAPFAVRAPSDAASRRIAVGAAAARAVDASIDLTGLGAEGFVRARRGDDLVLSGGDGAPRGALDAVSCFLEDEVGVRWWTPDVESVPARPTLVADAPDRRVVPRLEYRDVFWKQSFEPDWAMRNRVDGPWCGRDAARGGRVWIAGFVHTYEQLLPPAEHFAAHPEWYSLVAGKRVPDGQLCLSNPAVLDAVVERVRAWLREQPDASVVSVSQNDRLRRCECDACRAIEDAEGSPEGPILRFANAVAERIAPDHPGIAVHTLAYQYGRAPPRLTRPRPDVIVQLCSIECDFARPLADDANRAFRDDLLAWSRICDRLWVWDYTTGFSHYAAPFADLRALGPNVRLFAEHGVRGVLEEGNNTARGADWAELRAWVLAHLLWDPTRDAQALIDEFLAGYYGAAAPALRRVIDLQHDAEAATGEPLGIDGSPRRRALDAATVARIESALAEARRAVAGDAGLAKRVELAGAPIRYVALARWDALVRQARATGVAWPFGASRPALAERFARLLADHRIARLAESADGMQPELIATRWARDAAALPAPFAALPPGDVVDIQDGDLDCWLRERGLADWRADAAASDGWAAWMPGTHREWTVAATLDEPAYAFAGTWTAYLVARVDATADAGDGLACGIYDTAAKRDIASRMVPVARVRDGYRLVRIGACTPNRACLVWASPVARPEVSAVWIDRVILVRGERDDEP